jgi:hypothetical protein
MAATDDDSPLTPEERELSDRGAAVIAAAMAQPQARAPQALREALARDAAGGGRSSFGFAPGRLLALGGLAAVLIALVVALAVPGSDRRGPTVTQVAAVGRLPATAPPPAGSGGPMGHLAAAVGGLAFPDWHERFAWTAVGRRDDRLGGRAVTTVFYAAADGARLGYSIVEGGPVGGTVPGRDARVGRTTFRVRRGARRTTVSWTQAGHTCVIDAPSTVPAAEVVSLAAWSDV